VLGANGFVGSHLVDELVEAGYRVVAFDRFSSPPKFKSNEDIRIIAGDIYDDIAVRRALRNVDYVFHAFSATTPFVSDTDPYADVTQNILRNIQLFEQFVEQQVKKVLYVSSGGAAYGSLAERKVATENDAPQPVSPYGIGKLATEYYLAYYRRKYGLKSVSYRLTNPYGPRQGNNNHQGVVGTFINNIKAGQQITVYGNSTRDYIYVRDATKMIVNSFDKPTKHAVYNVGSGHQTSLTDIISAIETALDTKAKIDRQDPPKTFLSKARVSIARYTNEFGDVSLTPFEKGIQKTVKSFR
jgi:UDP-glucose 4-epimerase